MKNIDPYYEAVRAGDMETVIALIQSLALSQDDLCRGFGAAIRHGHFDVARYLLSKGATLHGPDVFRSCMQAKSIEVFEFLLECGWDVKTPDKLWHWALGFCVEHHQEPLIRWLLDHGADPNQGHKHPRSSIPRPFHPPIVVPDSGAILNTAAAWSTPEIFDLLLQYGAKLENSDPLSAAVWGWKYPDRTAMIRHLLDLGFDINGYDNTNGIKAGENPLCSACEGECWRHVASLLKLGANPYVKNDKGLTAMQVTRQRGNLERMEGLVRDHSKYPIVDPIDYHFFPEFVISPVGSK